MEMAELFTQKRLSMEKFSPLGIKLILKFGDKVSTNRKI
jgi:hypothetical protein